MFCYHLQKKTKDYYHRQKMSSFFLLNDSAFKGIFFNRALDLMAAADITFYFLTPELL